MNEPLIKPLKKIEHKTIKISLPDNFLKDIHAYMSWAGFQNEDDFIASCAIHVLENDKNYKRFLKENK